MATIPVNPERRDPGYLRRKAEIGLSNVDNISATDFVNTVADDVKIIGNRKITTSKFSATGKEYYIGILRTAELSSHVNFSTGLFKNELLDRELAQFNVDFSFSTKNAYSTGTLGYTIQAPDSDPYLKNLELIFTQVGSRVYVTLYSKSLPGSNADNFFNQIGTDITEWTEGTVLLDTDENYLDTIKGGKELARLKLDTSHTTVQSEYCESLPVYNKTTNSRELIEPRSYSSTELEELDYPSINGVPFIARKGVKINNQENNNARNIIVSAKHSGPTKEEAGGHDWDVLNNFKAISYKIRRGPQAFGKPRVDTYKPSQNSIQNDESDLSSQYGLCKPTEFHTFSGMYKNYEDASEVAKNWLNKLGPDDSDVITVGAFKEFMDFMFSQVFTNMSTTKSDETTWISYSSWNIIINTETSKISSSGSTVDLWVSASRIKTTTTYDSNGDVLDSTDVTENATIDQISVSISEGDGGSLVLSDKNSGKWEYTIPENTTLLEKTYHLLVYIDYGKSSEKLETITYTQEQKENQLVDTKYNLEIFNTDRVISSQSNTYDVKYLISITKTYSSGIFSKEYYSGHNVVIEASGGATAVFKENGVYQVTYPENQDTTVKTYTVTLKYQSLEKSLEISQSGKTEEDIIIGFDYILSSEPDQVSFNAIGGTKVLNTASYSAEIRSISGSTKIDELSYTVQSKPSWISIDSSNSDFLYNLSIIAAVNNTYLERHGEIVLCQDTSSKTLSIVVSQEAKKVISTNKWEVYNFTLNSSTIKLSGETRDLSITYINTVTQSNGLSYRRYYSGEDITVTVETISGNKTATAKYDNGWKIEFPESTTENTYRIKTEYQGVESTSITVYQGTSKISTDYVFEIDHVETSGTYNSNSKTISSVNTANEVRVYFNSYSIDYFDDGSVSYNNTDFIPFTIEESGTFIKASKTSNILTLTIPENTSTSRVDQIKVTQNISGKSLTLYISQASSTVENYISINSKKYKNNETCILESYSSSSFTGSLSIKPIKTVNGVDTDISYSSITVSENISWLDASYDSSTGVLSVSGSKNTSGSIRKGTIYLNYQEGEVYVSLSVSQKAGESYITIEESTGNSIYSISKSKDAQVVVLNVESNYSYTVSGSSSWAKLVDEKTKSPGTSVITFSLTENNLSASRTSDFTLTGEGGTTRTIRITQLSRTNYIDVVGFENSDMLVTTSSWKKQLIIPLKANQNFFIDYYSDWLKVSLHKFNNVSHPYSDESNYFNTYLGNYSEYYLYITPIDSTTEQTGGVISLSYYDSTSSTIISARKIFVNNIPEATILPYESKDIFVSGDSSTVDLHAYVANGAENLICYVKEKSNYPEGSSWETTGPISSSELQTVSLELEENVGKIYRDIYCVLLENMNDLSNVDSEPEIRIHQYPKKYLYCYCTDSKYGNQSQDLHISSEGDDNISISASVNCSSGYWELYGNSIPGWVSILKNASVSTESSDIFQIRVEPNYNADSRTTKLQFWCDSDRSTINTITITQDGSDAKTPRKAEYDFSLLTATTKENYMYLYGVKSAYIEKTVGSDGKSEDSSMINTKISTPTSTSLKIEYSIGSKNNYYYKDIYKVIRLECEDGVYRKLFIKNPRTTDVSIEFNNPSVSVNRGLLYSNAAFNYTLKSNIGLTGFYQETYYDSEKGSVDFTTLEVSSKASYNYYVDYFHNPEKKFYKQQVMDKMLFRNMDVIPGYTVEKNVTLPALPNSLSKNIGIDLYTEDGVTKVASIDDSGTTSYTVNLPSNLKNSSGTVLTTKLYFRAYDGVIISTSGSSFNYTCYQSDLEKKVGSLGTIDLFITAQSDNTGSSDKYLGSITLSIASGAKRIIQIYQKANVINLVGNASLNAVKENSSNYSEKWTKTEANLMYKGSASNWTLSFVHEYSNWMFVDLLENSGFTFNGKSYSGNFGSGGNSGVASSALSEKIDGCSYKSSVTIAPPRLILKTNKTLEMIEDGRYGLISTYGTGNITDKSNVKSIVHIYTRPDTPEFTLYTSSGTKVIDSSGSEGTGSIVSIGLIGGPTSGLINNNFINYPISFRVTSNYIDNCKNYIGKTIKMNGQNVKIESEYDLFIKLINDICVEYITNSGTVISKYPFTLTNYTTGSDSNGSYILYSGTIFLLGSSSKITSGTLKVTLNDFVIDSSLYYPNLPITVSTPVTFRKSGIIIGDGDDIVDPIKPLPLE